MAGLDPLFMLAQGLMYFDQQNKAEKATAAQRAASAGLLGVNFDTGAFDPNGNSFFANLLQDTAKSGRDITRRAEGLAGDYQTRQDRILNLAKGMGDAERAQLRSAYQTNFNSAGSGLVGAGLNNTTVGANLRAGATRDYGNQLRLLEGDLQNRRLGLETNLSADTLGAKEAALTARDTAGTRNTNLSSALGGMALNAIMGQQIQYPQFGPFDFAMSKSIARAGRPEQPNWFQSFMGGPPGGALTGAAFSGMRPWWI